MSEQVHKKLCRKRNLKVVLQPKLVPVILRSFSRYSNLPSWFFEEKDASGWYKIALIFYI